MKFQQLTFTAILGFILCLAPVAWAQDTALSERAKGRDANNNGVIDRDEAGGPLADNFDTMDRNKSGTLDGAEIRCFFRGNCDSGSASKAVWHCGHRWVQDMIKIDAIAGGELIVALVWSPCLSTCQDHRVRSGS